MNTKEMIINANTSLGIELGSTRIKAVLLGHDHSILATGGFEWENRLENGLWTYPIDLVWEGLQSCYADLERNVKAAHGVELATIGSIGISGMMHGYIALDESDNVLAPFRTWRNTNTAQAADELTESLGFNIPLRWSGAHLYQVVLNGEEHVGRVKKVLTLASYVHYMLTGEFVVGIGEASGMFPIDSITNDYDATMAAKFAQMTKDKGHPFDVNTVFPKVLCAGQDAGTLKNPHLLSKNLKSGIPMCPPEGDAGTGMIATNSIAEHTGNISAGTSVFAMIVLEKALSKMYREIDMVTTPAGKPVAMAHCNNGTSDIDAWVNLFAQSSAALGNNVDKSTLYKTLYEKALEGDADCGGIIAYNFVSGEPVAECDAGIPMVMRATGSKLTLENFMRAHLYSIMAVLKLGMDILTVQEKVELRKLLGHGGLFKIEKVAQSFMAASMETPIEVMRTAGEGGAWGIALLASFLVNNPKGQTLEKYVDDVCSSADVLRIEPKETDVQGFNVYYEKYKAALEAQRAAGKAL